MKLKKRLKNVSDMRRQYHPKRAAREMKDLLTEFQRQMLSKLRNPPVEDGTGLSGVIVGAEHKPLVLRYADKGYVAAEIDEKTAEEIVARIEAQSGHPFGEARAEALAQLIETGRFWAKHEARDRERREARSDPVKARAAGMGYSGPVMLDKGQRDGSCNRTACQVPLKGQTQFWMKNYGTEGGRLHYCADCADKFDQADRDMGQPRRCTLLTD